MAESIPPSPAGARVRRTVSADRSAPLRRARRWWPWRPPQSLRWWLGTTYMRVTLVAVVIVELVGLVVLTQVVLYAIQQNHAEVAERLSPVASELLAGGVGGDALLAYLERPISLRNEKPPLGVIVPKGSRGYTVVTDAEGGVWFDNRVAPQGDDGERAAGTRRLQDLPERLEDPGRVWVQRALEGGEPVSRRGLLRTTHAHPLVGEDGRTYGALLLVSTLLPATHGLVGVGLSGLAIATVLVVLIGTVFGLYASRPLVGRIEALSGAADAWGRGEFGRAVHDSSNDELGRLSRRLNHMAAELQELVRARQALAGTHERTRIARELHDSVKQQVFAASMRLGSARAARGEASDAHVAAAEALVRQAQQELSYVLKDVGSGELAGAVRRAARGEPTLHPRVALRLMEDVRGDVGEGSQPFTELTPRELEVLKAIAEGLSNAEIARRLGVADKTVKGHVSNVLSKLHLADRTQAAVYAWRQGVVHRDEDGS